MNCCCKRIMDSTIEFIQHRNKSNGMGMGSNITNNCSPNWNGAPKINNKFNFNMNTSNTVRNTNPSSTAFQPIDTFSKRKPLHSSKNINESLSKLDFQYEDDTKINEQYNYKGKHSEEEIYILTHLKKERERKKESNSFNMINIIDEPHSNNNRENKYFPLNWGGINTYQVSLQNKDSICSKSSDNKTEYKKFTESQYNKGNYLSSKENSATPSNKLKSKRGSIIEGNKSEISMCDKVFNPIESSILKEGENQKDEGTLRKLRDIFNKGIPINFDSRIIYELSIKHNDIYKFKSTDELIDNYDAEVGKRIRKLSKKLRKITIQNIEGNLLKEDNITISSLGIISSVRTKRDNICFFGFNNDNKVYNDVLLQTKFDKNKYSSSSFAITFDIELNSYFIQPVLEPNKVPTFIFVEVNKTIIFTNVKILLINDSIIVLIPENTDTEQQLCIQVYENFTSNRDGKNYEEYIYKSSGIDAKGISIGTGVKNCIPIQSKQGEVDSTYCTIFFSKNMNVFCIENNHHSQEERIWVALDQKVKIEESISLKIFEGIIKCCYI